MFSNHRARQIWLAQLSLGIVLGVGGVGIAQAGCVNETGYGGCYTSINAAVAAALPNETIKVAPGTYHEDVVIPKPLSLIGRGKSRTIIDATGMPNGIHIDGYENPGLSHVNVRGFTVQNANFQGILVTNASSVNIAENLVTGNNTHLNPFDTPIPTCADLDMFLGGIFTAGEGFDCGEGIHGSGMSHSSIVNNVIQGNAGGILLSDDTGSTHDNVLSGNIVRNNPYDCGITLASHHFDVMTLDPDYGVYHNTITRNASYRNGLMTGEGAGVGLFTGPPGAQTYGNVVSGNVLAGNGLPGVTMHSHVANQDLNDNLIVGNRISGNGPDGDPGTMVPAGIVVFSDDTGGAAPITGTVITRNVIKQEGIDIAVKTPGPVDAHYNSLFDDIGVSNLGTGSIDATENWWGCLGRPGAYGCGDVAGTDIQTDPWLRRPVTNENEHFFGDEDDLLPWL